MLLRKLGETYREMPAFAPALADSRQFPQPSIRVAPSTASVRLGRPTSLARKAASVMRVDHARTGLYLIARLLAPGRVWVPAYHCPAMVEPFIAAGCEVAFYPIGPNLEPDQDFIARMVLAREALVGVRFFGFDTGIRQLADLCASKEVLLIEDLAHAAYFDELLGGFGVTSLGKFLPVAAGGELLVPENSEHLPTMNRLYGDLPSVSRVRAKAAMRKLLRFLRLSETKIMDHRYFQADQIYQGFEPSNDAIVKHTNHWVSSQRRKDNYRYLAQALSRCANGAVMFPCLPDHVVPYVLPFLLNDDEVFGDVRRAGIQALRWEEMVATECDVSAVFRARLIQLPIHQDLARHQLDLVASALAN